MLNATQRGTVSQPPLDPIKHHAVVEYKILKTVLEMPDEEVFETLSTPEPPVSI
ncbi:MAG: hypothetical protein AAGD25_27590 [Cyanobacteria bacterium P01_F01_bin.150]